MNGPTRRQSQRSGPSRLLLRRSRASPDRGSSLTLGDRFESFIRYGDSGFEHRASFGWCKMSPMISAVPHMNRDFQRRSGSIRLSLAGERAGSGSHIQVTREHLLVMESCCSARKEAAVECSHPAWLIAAPSYFAKAPNKSLEPTPGLSRLMLRMSRASPVVAHL